MTTTERVQIAGLGLWLQGHASVAAWSGDGPDGQLAAPLGHALDRVNRRRASVLSRALADVCAEAVSDAHADPATIRTVIGSAIAESTTLLGLLEQIWRRKEPVSPAAFTVSVHNAASGLISIASGNRTFTTSLAADENTPAAALLEGIGLVLTSGQPVVVACGDETAPVDLVSVDQRWDLLASAVVLAPLDRERPCRAQLRITRPGRATLPPAPVEAASGRNPQIGLVDLIAAVLRGKSGIVRLDRGSGLGYCAELEPGRAR